MEVIKVICKYCNENMDLDSCEGIGSDEYHNYICSRCGSSCIVHENGEEDSWEMGENDEN